MKGRGGVVVLEAGATYNQGFPLSCSRPPCVVAPCHALPACSEVACARDQDQDAADDAEDVEDGEA
jgi:hypothetical protein